MWLELSNLWIVILNALGIPAIHLAVSWWFTKLDRSRFDPGSGSSANAASKAGGRVYQTLFRIRQWNTSSPTPPPVRRLLPRGNSGAGSRLSPRLHRRDLPGRGRALRANPALLLTLIWNPWPVAAIVMIVYAVLSNLPCLILQRSRGPPEGPARRGRNRAGREVEHSGIEPLTFSLRTRRSTN